MAKRTLDKADPPSHVVPRLARVLTIAAIICIFFGGITLIFPHWRLWGVHAIAFIPQPAAITLLICTSLLLIPQLQNMILRFRPNTNFLTRVPAPVIALGAGLLFYWQAVPAPLLGDGQLWLNELTLVERSNNEQENFKENLNRNLRKEPLEILIHDWAFTAILPFYPNTDTRPQSTALLERAGRYQQDENRIKRAATQTFRVLSALAGALFVWMVTAFARKNIPEKNRTSFLLITLGTSSLLLFFGYIEHYSWVSIAIVACLLSAIRACETNSNWWLPIFCAILAISLHFVAITLIPAIFFLIWTALKSRGKQKENAPEKRTLITLTLASLAGIVGYIYLKAWNGWISVLPLIPAFANDGYAIFSINHILDLANLILLIALPASIIAIFTLHRTISNATAFLLLAAISGASFAFSFNPNLGMAADWDILATALWPTIILAAWLISQSIHEKQFRIHLTLIAITLIIPLPYIWANLNTVSAIARYENILQLDPLRSSYGWEKLLVYHESKNDLPNAIIAGEKAVKAADNPRLHLKLADTYFRSGKFDDAAREAEIAARREKECASYLVVVALETGKTGNWRRCREILQIATECNPTDSSISNMLTRFDRDVLGH